ncbi:MAG: hypothetical protein ACKOTF_04880, partial [Opitutaceae bacterium]
MQTRNGTALVPPQNPPQPHRVPPTHPVHAQVTPPRLRRAFSHRDRRLPSRRHDPAARFGRLENGLRYVVQRNAEPKGRASLRLLILAG